MSERRYFTVEEAEATLPAVRDELEVMRECLAFLRCASKTAMHSADDEQRGDPSPQYGWALSQLEAAQRRLTDMGIQLRDVDRGLVDFPSLAGGRVVMLCWLEGEDRVCWFHDSDAGFGKRRPRAELEG